MPIGDQDDGGVAVTVAVARGGVHEPLDLDLGQVFPGPQVAVAAPPRCRAVLVFVGALPGVSHNQCD